MVQNKPTPEEQLLKLIEGGAANPAKPSDAAVKGGEKPASKKPSLQANFKKIAGVFNYFQRFQKNQHATSGPYKLEVKTVNRALIFLVVMSVLYLIIDFVVFQPDQSKILAQVSTSDAVFPLMNTIPEKISEDIAVYKGAVQKRNPFLPPQVSGIASPADSGSASATVVSGSLSEKLQGLKLVGISFGESPLAMIEEVATGRTFFVRKDQEVKGMKVQAISKEKVTLSSEGQEGDLF